MNLESLKKEAKRWLAALRAGDPAARERLSRTLTPAPDTPTLRDVQLALSREHGFAGWGDLKREIARGVPTVSMARYQEMADVLLEAYRTGTPEAMERHYQLTWHRREWKTMRSYVQLDLGKRPAREGDDVDLTLDDARRLIAMENGFRTWAELERYTRSAGPRTVPRALRLMPAGDADDQLPVAVTKDWDDAIRRLRAEPGLTLSVGGQMTDAVLAEVVKIPGLTALDLSGSRALTDAGLRHLGDAPALTQLDLNDTGATDQTLEIVSGLPNLERLSLASTRVTDAGVAHLARCRRLRALNLIWTRTGDGAIRALEGIESFRALITGVGTTDAGVAALHEIPAYKSWKGGELEVGLTSYRVHPNQVTLYGRFSDRGMEALRGLDGLAGLNLAGEQKDVTPRGLEALIALPHLAWLALDADDASMPIIARIPGLRFLGVQDTVAGDDAFEALATCATLESIWGRRCHNLRRRGFTALARLPRLARLSVSCLNVDDAGVSALPSFPALKELMPMDIPDAGYRHIGKCEGLEHLVLMYCRDTTDRATEQITGLRLTYYFNSYTTITDRTPVLLSGMDSLERITFSGCNGITDAGLASLARLPRLRELRASGLGLSPEAAVP
ncbi:MAG TPA: hypothetical protein VJS20_08840, partial [Gemmatimonadales bacterium]|nr:hypothetical protein [Gemmatimonadales bacterium]